MFERDNDHHRMLRELLCAEPSLTVNNVNRLVAWSDRPRQRMLAVLSRRAAATRYRIFDHHVTPLLIEALCTHCPT